MPPSQINLEDESHLGILSIFHFVLGGLYLLGIFFLVGHFMIMSMVFQMPGVMTPAVPPPPAPVAIGTPVESVEVPPAVETPGTIVPLSPPAPAPSAPVFPKEMKAFFVGFYIVIGVLILTASVCNVLSGVFIRKRKHRIFSMVIAGLNCLQIPFGTALGVFTLIVLARPSVRSAYDAKLQV